MAVVMKLWGDALGRPTPGDGQYLKAFDFEADDGRGLIDMTPDIAEAKRFPVFVDALTFYKSVPECRPLRPDGEPNRPLTATNWQFEIVEEDAHAD